MSPTPVKNPNGPDHLFKGEWAEDIAKNYLLKKGLKILDERFTTPIGEIDLIMQEKKTLVFVEVRSRNKNLPVDPIETVTHHKQRRIILTAQCYLQRRPWLANLDCRFDVVGILGDLLNPQITWIPDAFQLK